MPKLRSPRRGRLPSAVDMVRRKPVAASVVVEPAGSSITGKELTDSPARARIVPHSLQGCYRTLLQPLRGTVDQCVNYLSSDLGIWVFSKLEDSLPNLGHIS